MSANHNSRLKALTAAIKPGRCPTCGNYPTGVAFIDPETNEEWEHEFTIKECSKCGRPAWRMIHVLTPPDTSDDESVGRV